MDLVRMRVRKVETTILGSKDFFGEGRKTGGGNGYLSEGAAGRGLKSGCHREVA